MISLNGPQPGTLEAKELIKNAPKIQGEQNQYKETPIIKQKKERVQTNSKQTQVKLYVESKLLERVKKCLDAIPPEKYTISKFNETSDADDSHTDDE